MGLSEMTTAVAAVCPVDGLVVQHDGTIRVSYRDGASEAQVAAAESVIAAWPLQEARLNAAARVEAGYAAAIKAGITPQGSEITLAAAETDQNAFTRQATLLREAQEMGLVTDSTEQVIVDAAGTSHTLTIAQLRVLLIGYGMALKGLFDTRATKRAQAMAAETIEAADAINW